MNKCQMNYGLKMQNDPLDDFLRIVYKETDAIDNKVVHERLKIKLKDLLVSVLFDGDFRKRCFPYEP